MGFVLRGWELAADKNWEKIDRVLLTLDWKLNSGHEILSKSFFLSILIGLCLLYVLLYKVLS